MEDNNHMYSFWEKEEKRLDLEIRVTAELLMLRLCEMFQSVWYRNSKWVKFHSSQIWQLSLPIQILRVWGQGTIRSNPKKRKSISAERRTKSALHNGTLNPWIAFRLKFFQLLLSTPFYPFLWMMKCMICMFLNKKEKELFFVSFVLFPFLWVDLFIQVHFHEKMNPALF